MNTERKLGLYVRRILLTGLLVISALSLSGCKAADGIQCLFSKWGNWVQEPGKESAACQRYNDPNIK